MLKALSAARRVLDASAAAGRPSPPSAARAAQLAADTAALYRLLPALRARGGCVSLLVFCFLRWGGGVWAWGVGVGVEGGSWGGVGCLSVCSCGAG